MAKQQITFTKLAMDNFRLPGETVKEFGDQIKKLTDKDRKDIAGWFEAENPEMQVCAKDAAGNMVPILA